MCNTLLAIASPTCFQGLVCVLVNFKMKQYNAKNSAFLHNMSGPEKLKLQMTTTCYNRFEGFEEFYMENLLLYNFRQKRSY